MTMNKPAFNPYKVLGIPDNSPKDVCKVAYKRLIRKCHPDFGRTEEDIKRRDEHTTMLNDAMSMIDKGYKMIERRVSHSFTHNDLFNFSII